MMVTPERSISSMTSHQDPIHTQEVRSGFVALLQIIAGYLVVSSVAMPFVGLFWLGELPVLALIQVPKLWLATWLRTHVVMPAISALGLSAGSFSPDYLMARPYGVLLAYLIAATILAGLLTTCQQPRTTIWKWYLVVVALMTVDALVILAFGSTRSLSMY